ncbi:MAG: hypothetical protein WCT49_02055 [Candidatus Paceibacterota bacterium]|jgi:hypothetical protein|nr:hypothetical protein [Candidatus Paceibacterota bacterium]
MGFSLDPENLGFLSVDITQKYSCNGYGYLAEFYTKEGTLIKGKFEWDEARVLHILTSFLVHAIPRDISPELFFQQLASRWQSTEGYLVISRYREGKLISYEYARLEDL